MLLMWDRRVVEILEEVVGWGASQFLVGLKMWLINLNRNLLVYGPNSDGTEDYYGMSYLVFAVSGIFLGVWEETLMLCGFPLND